MALLVSISPHLAAACPVCFGNADSSSSSGVRAGILVLLGVTGTVLGLLGSLFLRLRRRAKITLNGSIDYPRAN